MVSLVPGKSSVTAMAMRWAVEWRTISKASGLLLVMTLRRPDRVRGRERSTSLPSKTAARAARAKPSPMDLTTSRTVVPASTSLVELSGRVMVMLDKGGSRGKVRKGFGPAPSGPWDSEFTFFYKTGRYWTRTSDPHHVKVIL